MEDETKTADEIEEEADEETSKEKNTQEAIDQKEMKAEAPKPEKAVKIFSLRTTLGRENVVMDFVSSRIRAQKIDIKSVLHPPELKGYMFIEGDIEHVQKAIQGIPHIRGLLTDPVDIEKIRHFLQPKTVHIELNRGDIVEIIGSPFKGEKARVVKLDKTKSEITLELLEAGVPIPVTIGIEFVRLVERTEK
ncbi:MAG: transcription elongation factor Spt5 [Candidatus Aenigmatarchaeota archaeon]